MFNLNWVRRHLCTGERGKGIMRRWLKRSVSLFFIVFLGILSANAAVAACATNEIDVLGNGTQCETTKFSVTTTSGATTLSWIITSTGEFYVDCGDGGSLSQRSYITGSTTSGKKITRTTAGIKTIYSCKWNSAGVHTVRFGGVATGYSTSTTDAAITFYHSGGTPASIASIDGSLGAMFPTINGAIPRFYQTFQDCKNLTGIPTGLFSAIDTSSATDTSSMFDHTFYGCTGLTGIPAELFSAIDTSSATSTSYMFYQTFYGCTGLTSISAGLFGAIDTSSATNTSGMFADTFWNCNNLTSIPAGLFGAIDTSSATDTSYMFRDTFYYCKKITNIPTGLFGAIDTSSATNTAGMFNGTFWGCNKITNIPTGLFSGVDTSSATNTSGMFYGTFGDVSGLTSIPTGLFSGIDTSSATDTHDMFRYTFHGCSKITSIPSGLFSGVDTSSSTNTQSMFSATFGDCTRLTEIPTGLFSAVNTSSAIYAQSMFSSTFYGCKGVTEIPFGLFSGIDTSSVVYASDMFSGTFYSCTGLTSIPAGLFSAIDTSSATDTSRMFQGTFNGCSNITGYIPPTAFPNTIQPGSSTNSNMWSNTFNGTQLLTTCPAGTTQYITGFESDWNGKASCEPCTNTLPEHASYTTAGTCDWACDSGYINTGTSCEEPKFSIATTNDATSISFSLSAVGEFYVDCGDGGTLTQSGTTTGSTISGNTITRTGTGSTTYICTWPSAGTHTIRFGGAATEYNETNTVPTISFYAASGGTQGNIVSVSGSLGSLFPQLGTGASAYPSFYRAFYGATNLTSIPSTLFSGITGGGSMFQETFKGCSSLTTVPAGIFANVSRSLTYEFASTFENCTSLTTIPSSMFGSVTGNGGVHMFDSTFAGCTSLATLPSNLFSSVTTGANFEFQNTFKNCTALTTIPSNTFGNVSSSASYLFANTFEGCTSLATLPAGLFSRFTYASSRMFSETFKGCTSLSTVPADTFDSIRNIGEYGFAGTFEGCTALISVPGDLFEDITSASGASWAFYKTFSGSGLTAIPPELFANITVGAGQLFQETFSNCTGLTAIPAGLFSGITAATSSLFNSTFSGCTNLSGYIPPTTFAGLIANEHPTATNMWKDTFAGTNVATQCPSGTGQYITGYEGTATNTWNTRVSCEPCVGTIPEHASYVVNSCDWACDSGYINTGTSCEIEKFSVNTTGGTFVFGLTAKGTFYVDWGDGSAVQKITRNNTTRTEYSHRFTSGTYTIRFGGAATGYSTATTSNYGTTTVTGAIDFFGKNSNGVVTTISPIASVSGSLGALMPQLGNNDGQFPRFVSTFLRSPLTTVPDTLFSGLTGGTYMFKYTFDSSSVTTLPAGLFSGITTPANWMFNYTFKGCSHLTTLPDSLFGHFTSAGEHMFESTFYEAGLTSLPANLFAGITTGTSNLFNMTFYKCRGLSTVPAALFNRITTGASGLFVATFKECLGLTSVPEGLFSGLTSGAPGMFVSTFEDCINLPTVPAGLFSGITTGAQNLFSGTFSGCTRFTTIPSGLFNGITAGAQGMFQNTFQGCSRLATVPSDLFSRITTGAQSMFYQTFSDCTSLTAIPSNLFSGITTPATDMFERTFYGSSNLAGYIPKTTFAGLITNDGAKNTDMWDTAFYLTAVDTSCPAGTTQYVTGYESQWGYSKTNVSEDDGTYRVSCEPCSAGTYKDVVGNQACSACPVGTYMANTGATSCTACTNTKPAHSSYSTSGGTTNTCDWACDSGYINTGTSCEIEKFSVNTTGGTFVFGLTAKGTFYVDWGDGSAVQKITRNNTTRTEYSHRFTSGTYTIRFGGAATGYSTATTSNYGTTTVTGAIDFFGKNSNGVVTTISPIASVSGSLGALMPQLGNNDGQFPRFVSTFLRSPLTTVPDTLFSGLTGGTYMFKYTFDSSSVTTLPAGLFSGITTPANWMFNYTFKGCSHLTTLPDSLFGHFTSAGEHMFESTFYEAGLTSLPANLFAGITTGTSNLFNMTFYKCRGLSTVPAALFNRITTGASGLFVATFKECLGLTSVPEGLFSGLTSGAPGMFVSTFEDCINLPTVPAGLFSGITTGAQNLFSGTFSGCTRFTTIPSGLFNGITAGAQGMFQNTFQGCSRLATVPSDLFSRITTGAQSMFYQTFSDCTSLTAIPSNLFSGITTPATDMFERTFYGSSNLAGYIPKTTFAGLITNDGAKNTDMWDTAFYLTAVDTSCPAGTTQYVTGYESQWGYSKTNVSEDDGTYRVSCEPCSAGTYKDVVGNQACSACPVGTYMANTGATSCTACTNTKPAHSSYSTSGGTTNTCDWACDSGYINTGTSCEIEKFSVTTTSDATTLNWTMTASGEFYVDCGDGGRLTQSGTTTGSTISGNKITRTGTGSTTYTCTWGSAGAHTVHFGGTATGYSTSTSAAAIAFYKSSGGTQAKVASISGSLGAMFPVVNGNIPRFYRTFYYCSNLSSIPTGLFSGINTSSATNTSYMFYQTFRDCASLGSIPAELFSAVDTSSATDTNSMFYYTFYNTSITSIPTDLFSTIDTSNSTNTSSMFQSTFSSCSNLTSIPAGLFSAIDTSSATDTSYMFNFTFGTTSIASIPAGLFSTIDTSNSTDTGAMFGGTFSECSNLTSIPADLFSTIDTSSATDTYSMFEGVFYGCSSLGGYIPPTTFPSTIQPGSSDDADMWSGAFENTQLLTQCPVAMTQYITGFESDWNGKVSCEPCPTGTYKDVVGNQACTACANGTYMSDTGATSCTACPAVDTGYAYVSGTGWSTYSDCQEQMRPTNCAGGYLTKTASSASAWGTAVSTLTAAGGYKVTGSGNNTVCSACGAGYYSPSGANTCTACASGLTTIGYGPGADEAGDCGHKFHAGDGILYLRSVKKTTPSLNVRIGNAVFYGNMSTLEKVMSAGSTRKLKINNGGTIYHVHDDSVDLPSGYTQVAYVQSSGNQAIDTGIIMTNAHEVRAKFNPSALSKYLYGSVSSGNSTSYTAYLSSAGNWRFGNRTIAISTSTNTLYESVQNSSGVTINGVSKGTYASTTFTSPNSLVLFGSHSTANAVSPNFSGKVYYIKIYNNGDAVFDGIPAKRNSDNVCGLYDMANNVFYASHTATAFICP